MGSIKRDEMILIKIVLGIILTGTVTCEDNTGCPNGWTAGSNKCYKLISEPFSLWEADEQCKNINGSIIVPETVAEYEEIGNLAGLGLDFEGDHFWIFFKILSTYKTDFPPTVVKVDGSPAPDWINDNKNQFYYGELTGPKGLISAQTFIESGKNRRIGLQYFQSNAGRLSLYKPNNPRLFGAYALCEITRIISTTTITTTYHPTTYHPTTWHPTEPHHRTTPSIGYYTITVTTTLPTTTKSTKNDFSMEKLIRNLKIEDIEPENRKLTMGDHYYWIDSVYSQTSSTDVFILKQAPMDEAWTIVLGYDTNSTNIVQNDDGKRTKYFKGGDWTHCSHSREAVMHFQCGSRNKLVNVQEPEKCSYIFYVEIDCNDVISACDLIINIRESEWKETNLSGCYYMVETVDDRPAYKRDGFGVYLWYHSTNNQWHFTPEEDFQDRTHNSWLYTNSEEFDVAKLSGTWFDLVNSTWEETATVTIISEY